MAMGDLHRGGYTGQYGFVVIDSGRDPGAYDQEVFLALRDWEHFYTDQFVDMDDQDAPGPQPEKPARLDTRPGGLEVMSQLYSINDKALRAGEPIRVRPGTRVLMHLLNASAVENRTIALRGMNSTCWLWMATRAQPARSEGAHPGAGGAHRRHGGNESSRRLDPGRHRRCHPPERTGRGRGIRRPAPAPPQWVAQPGVFWDYTVFGGPASTRAPRSHSIEMVFEKVPGGAAPFNLFTVNGKAYPHEREFVLQEGHRYRLLFRNRTDDAHPLHLHRHNFELIDVNGKPTSGILKDTVIVPMYGRVAVDLTADQPGLSLFHCHIQHHMDYGFKALFRYA